MRKLLVIGSLAALLAAALAPASRGQKSGSKNKPIAGTAAEYARLAQLREVVGRLAYVDSSTRKLALDISYQYPVANTNRDRGRRHNAHVNYRPSYGAVQGNANAAANLERQWLNLVRRQDQALAIRNPAQREQRLAQVAAQMGELQVQMMLTQARAVANMERVQMQALMNQARTVAVAQQQAMQNPAYKLAAGTKQFDLHGTDNIVVRRLNLPFEYDDKGYPKKYSKDEIQALRGKDPSLPGYTARYEDLQAGQMVKMYITRPKDGKKGDGLPVVQDEDSNGPPVRMVVILADSDGRDTPVLVNANNNKKKKKN